ncbi:MAG TPA: hypothetical protein VGO04_12060 [Ensifer sp.]|jgi:hypothetical protein|uniref:hypothetical protein n=1 Tax=Ensifer sp. TaxID=1872086 RepID=UPI002E13E43C|nr:hypothetical protein [Ensifer sp.]
MNPHELHLVMTDRTRPWSQELAKAADWSEWQDAPVPAGYDTVFSFTSRWEPEIIGDMEEPLDAMMKEQERLLDATEKSVNRVYVVPAPTALRRLGLEIVPALPVAVLLTDAVRGGHSDATNTSAIIDHYFQPKRKRHDDI